jgi:biotin carboxyl carrier protein
MEMVISAPHSGKVTWLAAEGDSVAGGDLLCKIEKDEE